MDFDVVFVTYNSASWLGDLFASLEKIIYEKKKLHLYFSDNASTDQTLKLLKQFRKKYADQFGSFVIQENRENWGFGKGNNIAAALGSSNHLLFLNIDTSLYPDTMTELSKAIRADIHSNFALWELRQLPYEHPKIYDPLTSETSWSSGACFAIRRDVYEQLGGYDESFFMYAEDVDLSWRVRLAGFRIRYIPKAVVNHYCYQKAAQVKPLQYIYSFIGNLHLRRKFGTGKDYWKGLSLVLLHMIRNTPPFPRAKRQFLKAYFANRKHFKQARRWHEEHFSEIQKCTFQFLAFDYEEVRKGSFWACNRPNAFPKVSVIVRTCGRPDMLRETLISLRNQTYPNIEIVVVEDGLDVSGTMIRKEFADLNIVYKATGRKVGRCVVGNEAMAMATGEYFNFLDDDDVFYADHVETLISALEKQPTYKAAYALAFETPVTVESKTPYKYKIYEYRNTLDERFSRLELLYHNLFPIQTVLFSRKIYEKHGGFNTELDVLEDWDLWIRYALDTPFLYVPKTTSQYRTPADQAIRDRRANELHDAYENLKRKNACRVISMTGAEMEEEIRNAPFLQQQCFTLQHMAQRETLLLAIARRVYRAMKR